ncbi:MAG TPA: erythromycin esterase family protein, partial [Albitalea sp.]|nr:erythromycin esterase family protein [Albitalea sp.]
DSASRGQWNVGQLVREEVADAAQTFLLGFTTHTGSVAAASDWDAPVETKAVLPSRADSIERLMHDSGLDRFVLPLRHAPEGLREALRPQRLQRAIGVIYRPDTERWSHYFGASLPGQFDALVHLDTTRAVRALDHVAAPDHTEEPETYPSGM